MQKEQNMNYVRNSDGAAVDKAVAIGPDGVIRDGFGLHNKMTMMDAAPILHQPGTMPMCDADYISREASRAVRKARLSDAWKSPVTAPTLAPAAPMGDVYARRNQRLEQAWQNGGAA
jgi:hypothetical protein